MKTAYSALYAIAIVAALATFCGAQDDDPLGATWSIFGSDVLGRDFSGTLFLDSAIADLSLIYEGEDGTTLFDNSFARFSESSEDAPQIVLAQDFDGLIGGQLSLIGDNILSTEVEIGTQPSLDGGSIIVWDNFSGFVSAGNISGATLETVNVPEMATLAGLGLGTFILMIGLYRQQR